MRRSSRGALAVRCGRKPHLQQKAKGELDETPHTAGRGCHPAGCRYHGHRRSGCADRAGTECWFAQPGGNGAPLPAHLLVASRTSPLQIQMPVTPSSPPPSPSSPAASPPSPPPLGSHNGRPAAPVSFVATPGREHERQVTRQFRSRSTRPRQCPRHQPAMADG
jgi:hypothetical protein